MPIYEYQCKKCGHTFEQLQKVFEKPSRTCPKCKKQGLTKLISNTSFQLKGTGWYVTDFKSKGGGIKENKDGNHTAAKKKEAKPVVAPKSKDKET